MLRRRSRPEPPSPGISSWGQLAGRLMDEGCDVLPCPPICRRKGPHEHLRHTGASADVIVSPAVTP